MSLLVKAAKVQDIPFGTGVVAECLGKPVALFNVKGKFFATQNHCLHRGGPLGEGTLEGSVVTCPWHAWHFDVCSGANADNPKLKLTTYPVTIEADNLLVQIDG